MRWKLPRNLALLALLLGPGVVHAGDAPVVAEAWARATPPGIDVGAAYMVIEGGARPDRLVGASCDRASMVHLHAVEDQGGVARMRAIDGVDVPAGGRVTLAPKSTHVMLMGLDGPLVAGDKFVLTLEFAESGPQSITVEVRPAGAPDDGARTKP